MSQLIVPRPVEGGGGGGGGKDNPQNPKSLQKIRKISTACSACKQRKTKCSGGNPCDACAARNSDCIYDATSDQRRKIANQRNVSDLAEAHRVLERIQHLLGGIIAIIRVGSPTQTNDLIRLIHTGVDLSQIAAYVRNEVRANLNVAAAFQNIDFNINGPSDLPSPRALLAGLSESSQTVPEPGRRDSHDPPTRR